ncbi:Deoxyribonuclease V [Candidatus Desulforudis audaxviator MP104C]|uniref:Endonuclease V n=2 Tax=Candidatus Desulforudis TaxID=471826 RepID=B1I6M6_DESAP|nr:Deoxyribonuclease V [Candidatus Desulforudis audaxviator MP104C]AZK60757.1 Endonuclease V [Candidatus Desulforudis audaxviator]
MKMHSLHPWTIEPAGARELQRELAGRLRFQFPPGLRVRHVCGVDVSSARTDNRLYAAAVVFSFPELELVEAATAVLPAAFPYVPGLLSFREGPVLLEALQHLRVTPDVVLCDGQGTAHPRGVGIASHLGLFLDRPTLGVAKTVLVGDYNPPGPEPGAVSPLVHQGRVVGTVLRTKRGVKPVFISPGHLVDPDTAVELALACCQGYRLPEPVRQAHLLSNRLRRVKA